MTKEDLWEIINYEFGAFLDKYEITIEDYQILDNRDVVLSLDADDKILENEAIISKLKKFLITINTMSEEMQEEGEKRRKELEKKVQMQVANYLKIKGILHDYFTEVVKSQGNMSKAEPDPKEVLFELARVVFD